MRHEHHKVFILIKFSRTDIRTKSLKSFQLHAAAYYWDAIPYLRYVGEEGNMRELPVRMRLRDGYARWPTAVLPHEDIRYEVIPTTLYRHHSGPVERRLRARSKEFSCSAVVTVRVLTAATREQLIATENSTRFGAKSLMITFMPTLSLRLSTSSRRILLPDRTTTGSMLASRAGKGQTTASPISTNPLPISTTPLPTRMPVCKGVTKHCH